MSDFGGRHFGGVFVVMAVVCVLVFATPAMADSTVTVSTTNSASTTACTLPDAVDYADGLGEPNCAPGLQSGTTTIVVPASASDYTVTSTLDVAAPTIIQGAGAADTVISGGGTVEVFDTSSTVTISGVTITDGATGDSTAGCSRLEGCPEEPGLPGGGISNTGTLTLTDDVVSHSTTAAGVVPTEITACFSGCNGASAGSGGNGGGIYNDGALTITGSTINDNSAGAGGNGTAGTTDPSGGAGEQGGNGGSGGSGGGIYNPVGGILNISDSTISDNSAGAGGNAGAGSNATASGDMGGNAGNAGNGGGGGGIYDGQGMTITSSTISANDSGTGGTGATGGTGDAATDGDISFGGLGGYGGGIEENLSSGESSSLTNATVAENIGVPGGTGPLVPPNGGGLGGGIYAGGGTVALTFSTVAGNDAFYGLGNELESEGGTFTESATIVASGTNPGHNCLIDIGAIVNGGANVDFGGPGDQCYGTGSNPELGPLQDNGGPTETMALGAGSSAIGLVPASLCSVGADQRGIARRPGSCDAGAYQFAPPTIASPRAAGSSPTTGTVIAQINPNFSSKDTIVTVKYGTTDAYGTSVVGQDIGRGDSAVAFDAALSGLAPATKYYVELLATNGDGTSTLSAGTFTTGPRVPGRPSVHHRINQRKHTARFAFRDAGATEVQCSLVKLKRNRKQDKPKPHYSRCRSPKTYKHLADGARYEFFVRGENATGVGAPATFKFKI